VTVLGDLEVKTLEVVLARSADDDAVLHII